MAKKAKEGKQTEYVNSKGLRLDGRKVDECRPIKIEVGVLPRADGSAYLEWGQNKIYAAVYGPRECLPKHKQDPYRAVLDYNYRMATFSVPDRKNPKPGRREIEISKVSGEALAASVMLEKFPGAQINVEVEVLDSNAGTRVAALTVASVALADAGLPMRDMVVGAGVGRAGGKIIVDLNKEEEDAPDAVDIPLAIMPNTKEIVLLQLDGLLSKKEWEEASAAGMKACEKIYEIQKAALKKKYLMDGEKK